ncbi:bacterial surface protein 26-residue PARCEL repeat-containing domain protein [Weissella oryzae SG25]|uniref:Bacterial surface protein 26-residue PARCEL repeat-containing domain protein n=1 Tax=Weissella oryzae (strain DSM 25784 / JCM 18191 / LMG 30913 / SG25) TaxID=1329250 RepID=A0A069CS34_WEIOS|nr:BspA family leucine-rich repeat surface protein [Weissella oryzae]GAK30043.1 bacterial surface protein 26-residue PARCEL repeat-containing domain protein [Weissella oryzae SG25]
MFQKFIKRLPFKSSLQKLLTIIFVVSLAIFISTRPGYAQEEFAQVTDEGIKIGTTLVETNKVDNDTELNREGNTQVQTPEKTNEAELVGSSLVPFDSQISIREPEFQKSNNAYSLVSETKPDELVEAPAEANEQIIGTWGTVPWHFQAGCLTFGDGIAPSVQRTAKLSAPFLADSKLQEYIPQIKQIDIIGRVILPSNSSALFSKIPALKKITGLSNLELAAVTDMREMFADNPTLVELPLAGFKTIQVSDVRRMFANIPKLEKLDLSNLDFSKVKRHRTAELFVGSNNLREITFMNRTFGQSAKTANGHMINYLEPHESSLMHVPVDARYGGKWIQNNFNTENQMVNRGPGLLGKQVLQNLGRKKGSTGTWVWAPALLGKAKEPKTLYVSPNMPVQKINALIKFNQAELVKLTTINASAVTNWRVEPTLLINNAPVDLGIHQVIWQIYTNDMAQPIDTFIGTVNLVRDKSALVVEDDWQFIDDFENYNPMSLVSRVVGPNGEELAKTGVDIQLMANYPKFGQTQQLLYQIKHHYWQSQKYSRKQSTLIQWTGEPIIKSAQLNLVAVKDQHITQGAKFDWTKSVVWHKPLPSNRVVVRLPEKFNQTSVDKPGEYIVTILLIAANGKQSSRDIKLIVLPLMAETSQLIGRVELAAELFQPECAKTRHVENTPIALNRQISGNGFGEGYFIKSHNQQQSSLPALAVSKNNIWTYVGGSVIIFVLGYKPLAKYTKKASSNRTSR